MVTKTRSLCVSVCILLMGCNGDDAAPDPCDAENAQAQMETIADADLVATVLYDELVEIDDDGGREKSTVISADFVDLTNYETKTDVTSLGNDCVGMVGRPSSTGEPITLSIDSIVIESGFSNRTTIEQDEFGTYFTGYTGDFFSEEGGEEITVTVSSSGDDGTFPSFSEALSAPAALVNETAAVTASGELKIEWQDGESTYVEVVLRSADDATSDDPLENRVRCFYLEDDGCFVVPYYAMQWLTSNGVNRVKVRMERHMLKVSKPAGNAISEIDAMRSIEFNINI